MFMTPWKVLAPWVLLLEQKSHLSCLNLQENLYVIIGENQSAAVKKRTTLHIFFTISDVIDVSNKLINNLALTE